ncbi:hypothetical protein ABW19_dt0205017 [Dactylella cylindrospora]|nr:hypothetical protein ABW19_dt0205017 [Dactylella cylindrospora]
MDSVFPSQLKGLFTAQETQVPRPPPEVHPSVLSNLQVGSVLLFFLYAFIFYSYASRNFKSYRKGHRDVIIIHALTGLTELSQFYLPSTTLSPTKVPLTAVILCTLQSTTNLLLVRTLSRDNPSLVRPVYQTGAFLRISLILAAYLLNSASLYHDSIAIIHAFAYTRLICFLFTTDSGFSETEVAEYDAPRRKGITFAQTYTAAVYGSALTVMGQMETGVLKRFGAVGFLVAVGGVMRVSGWVEGEVKRIAEGEKEGRKMVGADYLAWGLYKVGICGLSVLLETDRRVRA